MQYWHLHASICTRALLLFTFNKGRYQATSTIWNCIIRGQMTFCFVLHSQESYFELLSREKWKNFLSLCLNEQKQSEIGRFFKIWFSFWCNNSALLLFLFLGIIWTIVTAIAHLLILIVIDRNSLSVMWKYKFHLLTNNLPR